MNEFTNLTDYFISAGYEIIHFDNVRQTREISVTIIRACKEFKDPVELAKALVTQEYQIVLFSKYYNKDFNRHELSLKLLQPVF